MSSLERDLIIGTQFDRDKIELIKQTVAKGASDLELQLFFHACQRTGLDPLMKQIYAIKRWSSADRREVMSFQTGIDGYRLIADRTGQYGGSDEPMFEEEDGYPLKATVTVVKLVKDLPCRFTASARWEEYVQKSKDGEPTAMWKKMPYLMLAKCAEALALRKAFPAELSGVYTHEEMMQADTEPRFVSRKGEPAPYQLDEPRQEDGLEKAAESSIKTSVPPCPASQDAPASNELGQLMDYQAELESCADETAAQHVWDGIVKDASISSDNRKSLYQTYQKTLKRFHAKRGQGARG